ncbi:hypothetical protein GSI_09731 [Ganoderma sinense ZZ0214-1]|uniref:Uncharacterized protein n=1 Tax=Ganoderma sinense ZZ0214-1 TaxID=1077348 RepID=A0A2G8S370_9APHY|nr:hypothetical protein GSI_09731 [Ganoderma sinense ZZ0214-1]
MSSSISARMQELSLDSGDSVRPAATPQPHPAKSRLPEHRRPHFTSSVQVNPRPLPTPEECRAARKRCMYYGFYAGEMALQKMLIKCFPEQLSGRDPFDASLFLAGLGYVRDVTGRGDIGVHIAWVAQRNKDMVPSIGIEVGRPTFIVGLFPLEKEAYVNRLTQEMVDLLAEMFETKPTWWEIEDLTDL